MDHHHVPQFLLREWCGKDGKLEVYQRFNGKAVSKRRTPAYTGYEPDLYKINSLPLADQHWVETNLMTRAVDTPASKCLQKLLANGADKLSCTERSVWVRFIIAQWMRTPEKIAGIRDRGAAIVRQAIDEDQDKFIPINSKTTMREYVDANIPGIEEIVTMRQFLPKLIQENPEISDIITNMRWDIIDVKDCGLDLLLSDRPCLKFGGLAQDYCVILLPISLNKLFVAGDTSLRSTAPKQVVRLANRSAINASVDRVFASGTQHAALLNKWAKQDRNPPVD